MRIRVFAAFTVVLSLFTASSIAESKTATKNYVSFGVVPQQASEKLALVWAPLLKYLTEKTGHTFQFASTADIPTFDKNTANGDYDFVYMNPMYYTTVHQTTGYQVIAKEKDTVLKGLLVVHKDGPIQKLEDLDGKTIAFPGPIAFAATVLPLAELSRLNVNVTPVYVGSHEAVYNAVARGLYAAGGGVEKSLAQNDKMVRDDLRVLWTSETYTPHPIAAHPRVDKHLVEQVTQAMLELEQSPDGAAILKNLHFKGFVAAQDSEYENMKRLGQRNVAGTP